MHAIEGIETVGVAQMMVNINRRHIETVLENALEEGIFWCKDYRYLSGDRAPSGSLGHFAPKNFQIELLIDERCIGLVNVGISNVAILTEENLVKGIEKMREFSTLDFIDPEVADMILQYALWGRIIFG